MAMRSPSAAGSVADSGNWISHCRRSRYRFHSAGDDGVAVNCSLAVCGEREARDVDRNQREADK